MAQYTKATDANGTVRYKDGTQFVGKANLPQNILTALDENPEGTVIDELGEVVDPTTETDEGSEDENLPTKPAETESETSVEDDATEEETEEETQEEETEEESETEEEAPAPAPAPAPAAPSSRAKKEVGGMGFPAAKGKTLSIFSDVPHETVKNIGGVLAPLTHEEYATKTDAEIIIRLKELGKI